MIMEVRLEEYVEGVRAELLGQADRGGGGDG
jgi:hypothetical protein